MIRAIILAALVGAPAAAQTTAADILSALEEPTAELAQLTAILEGADEERALVAMRLMLASGDAGMERLALRAGLTSTNGVARGVALEGYLAGQPTLLAFVEHEGEVPPYFSDWLGRYGSVASENTGSFAIPVGPLLEELACYSGPANLTGCAVRVGGTEISFQIGPSWGAARLNENGELIGAISHKANSRDDTGPMKVTIPLLGQLQ